MSATAELLAPLPRAHRGKPAASGLRNNKPRAWTCTGPKAIWCPLCGTCNCQRLANGAPSLWGTDCPLHARGTQHPTRSELVQ